MQRRSRWGRWGSALVVAAALSVSASCADDDAPEVMGESVERSTTTAPPTSTGPSTSGAAPATTTTVAVGMLPPEMVERPTTGPPRDWEGQRYDFGTIRQAKMAGADRSIVFDRKQLRDDHGGLSSGPTLTEEPIVVTERADVVVNTSRGLREFTVAPDVRVRQLDPAWTCDPSGPAAPAWNDIPYESLVIFGVGDDDVDSLIFDDAGSIVQIRLSRTC